MSLRNDLSRVNIINFRKFMVPVVSLTLILPIAYDAWRGERGGAQNYPSNTTNEFIKENSGLDSRYHSGAPAVANVFRHSARGIDPLFDKNYWANELPINIGYALDADTDNGFEERQTGAIDIGEPSDPDSPLTDYTNETPLNLGELLDADNPSASIINDPSAYQNIGTNMVVGEEFNWLDDEPQNIGPVLDVDT